MERQLLEPITTLHLPNFFNIVKPGHKSSKIDELAYNIKLEVFLHRNNLFEGLHQDEVDQSELLPDDPEVLGESVIDSDGQHPILTP